MYNTYCKLIIRFLNRINTLIMQAPSIEAELKGSLSILERITGGDKSAVEECIGAYSGLVWKIARKYSRSNEDIEDAVQEIFLTIWMNAHRFDPAKSPETAFICLLAQRKAIDLLRRNKSRFSEIELPESGELPNEKHLDYKNVFLNLDLQKIKSAFKNLSASENELLRLSVYEGNSHTEIAEIVGMPLGTVKSKIRRGLGKVKASVGKPFLADLYKAYYG